MESLFWRVCQKLSWCLYSCTGNQDMKWFQAISLGLLKDRNSLLDTEPSWRSWHSRSGWPLCSAGPSIKRHPRSKANRRSGEEASNFVFHPFHTITMLTHPMGFPADWAGILALVRPVYFQARGNVKLQKMSGKLWGFTIIKVLVYMANWGGWDGMSLRLTKIALWLKWSGPSLTVPCYVQSSPYPILRAFSLRLLCRVGESALRCYKNEWFDSDLTETIFAMSTYTNSAHP